MEYSAKIVGKKLIIDGYVYLKSRERKNKTYWDCNRLRGKECSARAVTMLNGDEVIVLRGPVESKHETHPSNHEEGEAEVIKHRLKRTASEHSEQPPAHILRTELANVPLAVVSQLPERSNLAKSMRVHRRRDLPPNPKSLDELESIPELFTNTMAGEKFLTFDSQDPQKKVNVFATRRNLEILARSTTWFLDGTFKVAPTIITQLFTILGLVKRNRRNPTAASEFVAFPLVYAFLSSKETSQYTTVLEAIDTAAREYGIPNFKPRKIMGDFEKAIINACAIVYPEIPYSGCFFHFCQSIYRKLQGEGLQEKYKNPLDRDIKLYSHMLMALAFVPEEDVQQSLRLLFNDVPVELLPIVDYIEEYYVTGKRGRGRRRAVPPRYSIALWNHYQATIDGQHKTNNISEGWHNRFRLIVGKHQPDLYSALREIQKEQADSEKMIAELSLGRAVKAAQKKKWLETQNRLRSIVLGYDTYKNADNVLEYLRLVSYNIVL